MNAPFEDDIKLQAFGVSRPCVGASAGAFSVGFLPFLGAEKVPSDEPVQAWLSRTERVSEDGPETIDDADKPSTDDAGGGHDRAEVKK